jgi:hypothetical protein
MWDSAMQPNEFLTLFAKKKEELKTKKQTICHVWGEREKKKRKKKKAERS